MSEDKKTVTMDAEVAAKADTNGDGHISAEEYAMELEFKRSAQAAASALVSERSIGKAIA